MILILYYNRRLICYFFFFTGDDIYTDVYYNFLSTTDTLEMLLGQPRQGKATVWHHSVGR